MKRYFKASMLLMGLLFIQLTAASAQCPIKEQIMNGDGEENGGSSATRTEPSSPVSHTLIIFFDRKTGNKPLLKAIKKQGCTLLYKYKEFSGVAVKVDENQDIDKAIADFRKVKGVVSVNKDGIMQLQ
ncbi:hypothetical protein J4864_00535 [Prevotella multiformis]|uniref:hypothetical protein n=1 Tax=Prevotella multiformis TaxID=282402 RepID=UPI001BAB932E|nr:hypothetical protein [Prevotella multiformis]QUB70759.1 hypothetical protein J4864_00535 [Prevotella multiformis]